MGRRIRILGATEMAKSVVGYVMIVTEVGKEHEVVEEILKIEGVIEAQTVYGEFDIMCKAECNDLKTLDSTITKVRKIPRVIRTMTLISG